MNPWFWIIPTVIFAAAVAFSLWKHPRFPAATATAALASAYFYGMMALLNAQIEQTEKLNAIMNNNSTALVIRETDNFRVIVSRLATGAEIPTVRQLEQSYDVMQTGLLATIIAVLVCGAREAVRRLRQLQSPL